MQVFVTGGARFIGSAVVRKLRARGSDVVRRGPSPERARALRDLGCRLVRSDLSSIAELSGLMAGSDAVIHGAGVYRVGVSPRERPAIGDSNVGATTRVLAAAEAVGVARTLYVSTVNVFGDTHGGVVGKRRASAQNSARAS